MGIVLMGYCPNLWAWLLSGPYSLVLIIASFIILSKASHYSTLFQDGIAHHSPASVFTVALAVAVLEDIRYFGVNSSEAKASRVIIYKFPVKFRSIVGSREPRSPDTCIPMVSCTAGIPSSAHVSMRIHSIQY